jgi:Transposase DDE domain group 1
VQDISSSLTAHPEGESEELLASEPEAVSAVDTFGGKLFVRWDPEAAVTTLGPVSYFIDFLKTNGLWEPWVRECPLLYASPHAPTKEDILGTLFLSVLAGHKRYAHITTIRSDNVLPGLLGMKRVRSEDAVRRAFQRGEATPYEEWLRQHLTNTYGELLNEPWILDMDATVKPLYGQQEQAVRGYNPSKPGRPSHVYHCYFLAALRLVLDVEVQPGNQTASQYAQPGLWAWLDRQPRPHWPRLLRGDVSGGTERMRQEAEQRQLPYLFKLRQSPNVKKHVAQVLSQQGWQAAGGGWQGVTSERQLSGWSRARRIVVLRRLVRDPPAVTEPDPSTEHAAFAGMAEVQPGCEF